MSSNASESVRFTIKAAGFGLMLWVPLLGPLGWLLTGVAWLSPLVVCVAVPLLDFVIGDDRTNEAGSNGTVRADLKLTHPADLNLTRGWVPAL